MAIVLDIFMRKDIYDRIIRRMKINPHTGCWEWQGSDSGDGYGKIRVDGKSCMVHRVSYSVVIGRIPDGHVLDHLCSNRRCVNPNHLQPVTQKENVKRGKAVLFTPAGDIA